MGGLNRIVKQLSLILQSGSFPMVDVDRHQLGTQIELELELSIDELET